MRWLIRGATSLATLRALRRMPCMDPGWRGIWPAEWLAIGSVGGDKETRSSDAGWLYDMLRKSRRDLVHDQVRRMWSAGTPGLRRRLIRWIYQTCEFSIGYLARHKAQTSQEPPGRAALDYSPSPHSPCYDHVGMYLSVTML